MNPLHTSTARARPLADDHWRGLASDEVIIIIAIAIGIR